MEVGRPAFWSPILPPCRDDFAWRLRFGDVRCGRVINIRRQPYHFARVQAAQPTPLKRDEKV